MTHEAEKAIWIGAGAAFFLATANVLATILTLDLVIGFEVGLALFDGLLIFILGFGIYKKSRVSGAFLILYFVFSRVGSSAGIFINLIFLLFFWRGLQGTIAYHQIEKVEDSDYVPDSIWIVRIISSVIGLCIAFILMLVLGSLFSSVPGGVTSGAVLEEEVQIELVEANLVSVNDTIELFYCYDSFSLLESGNILTHERFIRYFKKGGQLQIEEIALSEITAVVPVPNDDLLGDLVYNVVGNNKSVELRFAFEDEGDQVFVKRLNEYIPNK